MLLKNNEDRIHNLAGRVTLLPGTNRVDDGVWKEVSKQSGVRRLMEARIIETVREGDGGGGDTGNVGAVTPGMETDLAQFSEPEQIRLVGETVDRALLLAWHKKAGGAVKEAIDAQLAAIGLTEEERASATKKKAR